MPDRFPRRKYIRHIAAIRHDLWSWAYDYSAAAETAETEWLQGRFLDRAAILKDAIHWLDQVQATLAEIPDRLSR